MKTIKHRDQHASVDELNRLIFGDETCEENGMAAAHVENCQECQTRLAKLATSAEFDSDVNQMLSGDSASGHCHPRQNENRSLDFLGPPSHPEMLGRIGRYEVERVIGSGGMGVVLKAFDTELNRPVAIKVLAAHLAHSGAARQRFAREVKAAAAVVHENVVAIHNVESSEAAPYLVMQFIAGESVQARVDRDGPLETKELLRIAIQVASGLAAAHEQGVIHRDIKPANILMEYGVERTMLTDFGLARTVDDASLTQTGVIAGTPNYMSPEQANGQPTDHRTDLFSLGAVLYFMSTGHPPFRAERAMGVLNRICHDRQKPLWQVNEETPDELSVLVDRLLEKQPARRPVSAEAVRGQLTRLLAQLQHPRTSWRSQLRRLTLRYPRPLMAFGIAIALLVTFGESLLHRNTVNTDESPSPPSQQNISPSPVELPSTVPPVFDNTESTEFSATMDDVRRRLERLNRAGVDITAPGLSPDMTTNLQSVDERLQHLQQVPHESQLP